MSDGSKGDWTRRRALLFGAGAVLATLPVPAQTAQPPAATQSGIRFDLLRYGIAIGDHAIDFQADGDRLEVRNRIDVSVGALGVVLFEFLHSSRESYEGERLVAFDSETTDGDGRFFVSGRASDDGFTVRTRKGTGVLPADTLVASYWSPRVLTRPVLLDPQRGRLKPQVIEAKERISIDVAGESRPATRYRISGVLHGTVVFDDEGRWLAATVMKKNSEIVYRLRS
jgi:hypothetical protein